MKLIIDIPEKAYELLKSKSELDNIAESIIANGIPYEERSQGELADEVAAILDAAEKGGNHEILRKG